MTERFLRVFLKILVIIKSIPICYCFKQLHHQNFSLLLDFTCATAKNELEKHPEMRTIAMVELENNFPSEFDREVLKCLPEDVAKVIINPHTHIYENNTLILPKQTFVIFIADKVLSCFNNHFMFLRRNFPVVHHLSKHLIVSSDKKGIKGTEPIFKNLSNIVQIYEENQKVFARSFDEFKSASNIFNFSEENLTQILFPDRTKNLHGQILQVVFNLERAVVSIDQENIIPNHKFTPFLINVAEKLNANLNFSILPESSNKLHLISSSLSRLLDEGKVDILLNYPKKKFELECYNYVDYCFIVPLPEPFSITELILFLPMDKSCWMWLMITIAVSTLLWRVSEGHWNFFFGSFAYLMGQAQLTVRIRTSRLTMKILLQVLIFTFFIFSNGYQSLVTSFMLDPVQEKLMTTVDELFDSNLKIKYSATFHKLQKDNPKYQKTFREGRVIKGDSKLTSFEKKKQLAYSKPCKIAEILLGNKDVMVEYNIERMYMIPEVAKSYLEGLFVRPFHPLIDKFQELMDQTFEAGLHQVWEQEYLEKYLKDMTRKEKEEKKETLDFGLIAPFFVILIFGFVAGLIVLLCEIFHHDFVSELTKEYLRRKLKEIIRREIVVQSNQQAKVQRTQVKPVR